MICNAGTFSVVGVLIGLHVTTFVFLAPNAKPFVFGGKTSLVEEKWTAQDLGTLARTSEMAAAVACLENAARESGASVLEAEGLQGIIDAATDADIRIALLKVAKGGDDRKKDPLAVFARTDCAAATCGSSGTAGGDGLAICVERCERKSSMWDLTTPHGGACYTLCSLAVSPCTQGRFFSWGGSSENWGVPLRSWVTVVRSTASLSHAKGMEMAQSMTAVSFKNWGVSLRSCVAAVRTAASLVHAKGMEIVQNNAVSTALAGLSFWAKAAGDYLGNSETFRIVFLLSVAREVWMFARNMLKRAKKATNRAKKISRSRRPSRCARGSSKKRRGFTPPTTSVPGPSTASR